MVMLSTLDEDGTIHSRPMGTQEIDEDGNMWFFTSSESGKVASIEAHPQVNLSYAEPKSGTYVSVVGEAQVTHDPAKARELWNPMMKAWFPEGVNEPDLVLLKVAIQSAEYWDAPQGKMVQMVGIAKAALSGKPFQAKKGEHGKVILNLNH
jgi:general stress protein 26